MKSKVPHVVDPEQPPKELVQFLAPVQLSARVRALQVRVTPGVRPPSFSAMLRSLIAIGLAQSEGAEQAAPGSVAA